MEHKLGSLWSLKCSVIKTRTASARTFESFDRHPLNNLSLLLSRRVLLALFWAAAPNSRVTCMLGDYEPEPARPLISKSVFKQARPNGCSETSTLVCPPCMFPSEWRIKRAAKQQRLLIIDEPIWDSVQPGRGGLSPNISAWESAARPRCQTFPTGVFSHLSAPQ